MDRETVAVMSYWTGFLLFFGGILAAMILRMPALMGPVLVINGVQQIYFREELAAHFAKAPRVIVGHRGSLRKAWTHRVLGLWQLILGLFVVGAWLFQLAVSS